MVGNTMPSISGVFAVSFRAQNPEILLSPTLALKKTKEAIYVGTGGPGEHKYIHI